MVQSAVSLYEINPHSFTSIHGGLEEFKNELDKISDYYQDGKITYICPVLHNRYCKIKEGFQDRIHYREGRTLDEVIEIIETDRSSLLFIQYGLHWSIDKTSDDLVHFGSLCHEHARLYGTVILLSNLVDRELREIEKEADEVHCLREPYKLPVYSIELKPADILRSNNYKGQMKLPI